MLDKWIQLEEQPYREEDAEWDEFVAAHPQGSLLQTTNWARLKNRFGWASHRVWLRRDDKLVAGAQVLYRPIAMRMAKIAYIPHGPIVNWDDAEQVSVLFSQIDLSIYQRRAGLLKIEPLLWQDEIGTERWQQICQDLDLRTETDTMQPPNTVMIDLRPSEEDILAAMKQKTRYNVRLAGRKDVTVRRGTKADLNDFIRMMHVTGERDGFGVRAADYYRTAYDLFSEKDEVGLFLAEYEGKALAGVMAFRNGDTAYNLFSASSNEERNRMPNYAVQWEVMRWAKQLGCTQYDMWGAPDATEEELEDNFLDRKDGLWGVYRFKRGFGGNLRRTVGAVDRVYNERLYKLYKWRRGR